MIRNYEVSSKMLRHRFVLYRFSYFSIVLLDRVKLLCFATGMAGIWNKKKKQINRRWNPVEKKIDLSLNVVQGQ